MNAKIVIFVLIPALVVAPIYSSAFIAFVGAETKCTIHPKNGDTTCVSGDKKSVQYCWHDPKTGRVAGCITISAKDISAGALTEALGSATVQDKPDKTFEKALDAAKQESPNATMSEEVTVSQDRFCKEGTGGTTGIGCVPCDPGLKIEVGCIDTLTGGPLETDTATSESGQNNTKGPKPDLLKDNTLLNGDNNTVGNDDR